MKKLIAIADWANDSLTCQEVRSTVAGYLKDPDKANISFVASIPSTIHAAFLTQQIVETEERYGRPLETVIFANTDTRAQAVESVDLAKGADFAISYLKSGIYVIGPNAGYIFSLIKYRIDELFIYKNLDQGSQFRSRDLYSRVAAHFMDELEDELDLEEISTNNVPQLDKQYVGHIDNFGNIKTTIKLSSLTEKYTYGDLVTVEINGVKKTAKFTNNLFGGGPGVLVIYPGSSGRRDDPYVEVTVWRHFNERDTSTGLQTFNNPRPGMEVNIKQ